METHELVCRQLQLESRFPFELTQFLTVDTPFLLLSFLEARLGFEPKYCLQTVELERAGFTLPVSLKQ